MIKNELAQYLEHSLLKADTTLEAVRQIVQEALEHGFAAVCIPPFYCRDARRFLGESNAVRLATVVGFPMGYAAIASKSEEIKRAVDEGADDIDAVVNIAAIKTGNWNHVEHDIDSMARATHMRGRQLKLILECGLLTDAEIERVCQLAAQSDASFVKTSTGMFNLPTTAKMVSQLRKLAPASLKIKASGGIHDRATALALIEAGAHRIGTSASLKILSE